MKSFPSFALLSIAVAHRGGGNKQEGEMCGGFAGFTCASGLQCRYEDGTTRPPYPDASGTCWDPSHRGVGEMCGGIAGFQCASWLRCVINADHPDASGECVECPLRKCASLPECPAGSSPQETKDENGCPGCPCCMTDDGECVDALRACGRGLPQCPSGFFCDVAPNDAGSFCRPEQRACTMDAKLCPDGSSVGRDPDNNCTWFPCPSGGRVCTTDARICPDGSSVGRNPDNNCKFYPCPTSPRVCTEDAKICASGVSVGRDPDNHCKFFPCPQVCHPSAAYPCSQGQRCNPVCKRASGRVTYVCQPAGVRTLAPPYPRCPQ